MFIDSPLLTGSVVLSGSLYVTDLIYGTLSGSSTGGGEGVGFPFSGSAVITGSLIVSGGIISGDGSGLTNITVAQATSEVETFVNQTNVTVEHNLNSSNLTVAVYNNNGVVIQPGTIQVTDTQVILTFASPTTGKVVITRGGHLINSTTASYSNTSTSASYALTASYALNAGGGAGAGFPFSGSGVITGSLFVSGGTVSGSFVGDGSGLKNITFNESVTVRDTFTTATTKIVTHNFNTKDVVVTTYLDDDTLFFPETITTTDENTVTLGFNTPTTGRVVVVKGGHLVSGSAFLTEQATIVDNFSGVDSKTVTHNFNTKNVIVSVYLDNDFMIIPDNIKTDTANTVTVTLDQPRSGRIVVAKGGHLVSGVSPNSISSSYALTASYALNAGGGAGAGFPFSGSADITGSLTVTEGIISGDGSGLVNVVLNSQTSSFAKTTVNNNFDGEQVFNNINVIGTASFGFLQSITGSATYIGDEYIVVNAQTVGGRFAGIKVYDQESGFAHTASLAWDSVKNKWLYSNPSGSYHGGGLISGPRNTGSLGEETYPTLNYVVRSQGGDHIYDSNIIDNDIAVSIGINTEVTGSLTAISLVETSALRFKENIQENLDSSIIEKLRPVSYNWKENKEKDYGFIAEEVNELDSILTTKNEDGEMVGVKYTKLIPFLVKKIQEQEERIKQLENGNS